MDVVVKLRLFNYKPIGTRTRSRSKCRWTDCAEDDIKVLSLIGELLLNDRNERVLEKALTHPRLLCQ
ncbi:hypothetical protein TNCV_5031011 [Trichonephila clavipes]|nr:hypothetical protein TNCV_5031011 [Trichonephila clavipes]